MSRAQKLRQNRKQEGDEIPDYETYDFSPLTEKDPVKACMLLKFGRKGHAHEAAVRLSEDKTYVEWEGRWFTRKKPEERRVYLEQAERVQAGQKTVPFERLKAFFGEAERNSFSIIYGNGRSLDLIAPTPEMYKIWYDGLQSCLKHIQDLHANMDMDRRFLKEKFDSASKKGDTVTRKEVQKLVASMNIPITTKAIYKIFKDVDRDKNGTLTFEEFTEFMNQLRRRPELEVIWDIMVTETSEEGMGRVQPLTVLGLKEGGEYDFKSPALPVSLDRMRQFWHSLQNEMVDKDRAIEMIIEVTPNVYYGNEPVLSYMGWVAMITQPENDAYDPARRKFNPASMHRPLSHYFIASSHNTYLTGDQLQSQSSVNRYIDDLCKNCRCVELDCWDGETEDQEPIIYHGHTLTSKIKFEDVVIAIKNYAFKTSPYPLILSIENHCSLAQQEKMAQMFIYEFGSLLLHPGEFPYEVIPGDPGQLPSPEQLRKKIIIKGKVIKKGDLEDEDSDSDDDDDDEGTSETSSAMGSSRGLSSQTSSGSIGASSKSFKTGNTTSSSRSLTNSEMEDETDDSRSEYSDDTQSEYSDDMRSESDFSESIGTGRSSTRRLGKSKKHSRRMRKQKSGSSSSFGRSESSYSSDSFSSIDSAGRKKKKEKKSGTHPALSAITFLGTCKHKTFKESIHDTPCNLMSSFSETKTLKYLERKKVLKEWQEHNTHHVSRIYPKGARVDSSNLDPTPAWAAGNHMVALNYQTPGEAMQLNDAKFRENGGCGYVLKPEYMLDQSLSPQKAYILHVHLISGQQLPKVSTKLMTEVLDPFVTVSVHGVPRDYKLYKSGTVKNNGFNPIWDQVFEFKIRYPDVAQLMFRVYDEDNTPKNAHEFIAYSSVPLSCLRTGLRSVALYDEKGNKKGDFAFASLVIRTEITEWEGAEEEIKKEEEEKESKHHKHDKEKLNTDESIRSFTSIQSVSVLDTSEKAIRSGSSSKSLNKPEYIDPKYVAIVKDKSSSSQSERGRSKSDVDVDVEEES